MNWRLENRSSFGNTLQQWWNERDFVMAKELLPERIYVVSGYSGMDLYAIPVYITDSEFAWMGFPTGNPRIKEVDSKTRTEALNYLIEVIQTTMKYQGYSRLFTTSFHPTIMETLDNNGFTNAEQTNFYVKILE